MESADLDTPEITSVSSLNDFLSKFQDVNLVNKCIESITYDIKSQTVVIQMQKLVKNESEKVNKSRQLKDLSDEKIKSLSESYREKFPELLDNFEKWKPVRKNLIEILSSSLDKLDRNFALVSTVRILTSTADIIGTLRRAGGQSHTSWSNFAMEHASTFGLLSLVAEKITEKKMLKNVKREIRSDQELFRKIVNWFKQTDELDKAVKDIFPYGIDPDITKKIAKSASDFNDCNKIFMSIVASNVKEDVKLFKDEKFLDKADQFANSEAGKQWFHKLLLKDDPHFSHQLNSQLHDDIQYILRNSQAENPEFIVDGYRVLSSKVKLKIALNLITIVSSVSNLLFGSKPEESDTLKELLEKTKEELEGIEKIVRCLNPTG